MQSSEHRPNKLADESSPYLRQHAHNPVDWYPWGPEALDAARREDKPIFLSVGYSACHWCHVMAHESFESDATAAQLNRHFINVKVDREERPDIDQIYMNAVQLMTGRGGWPMSVWLTPDQRPFYGGTYYPPERRHQMPSFGEIIEGVAAAWRERRDEVNQSADRLSDAIRSLGVVEPGDSAALADDLVVHAGREVMRTIDPHWGGVGRAPKFPHSVELRLLLRAAARTANQDDQDAVVFSLERMYRGGMYDHLGGGFHRYSTDEHWLVPHFEKMLYDNALLPLAYLEAYQLTRRPMLKTAAVETLDFILSDLLAPEGAFYGALDADSEGEEGKYYVWSRREIDEVLGPEASKVFSFVYDVTEAGNWEGTNVLNLDKSVEEASSRFGIKVEAVNSLIADARQKLLAVRKGRIPPLRDEKILTAWNGLAIDALATIGSAFEIPRYVEAACRAADFIMDTMRTPDGLLLRTYSTGQGARLNAYLEDYAMLAGALISNYEATFDPKWIGAAKGLVSIMLEQFWDERGGGFFYTGKDHENLIARSKEPHDGAIPAGASYAVTAMARLGKLTGDMALDERVAATREAYASGLARGPSLLAQMVLGLSYDDPDAAELCLVADIDTQPGKSVVRLIRDRYWPNKVVALRRPTDDDQSIQPIGLLSGKTAQGEEPVLYICRGRTCSPPIVGAEAIESEIARTS